MNTPTPPAEFMKQAEREAERQFNTLAAPAFVEGAKWAHAALAAPPVPTAWHVHFPGDDGSADWVQLGAERPDLAQWPEAVAIPLSAGAAPPVPAWQPIETAPKDGTAVLVMRDIWPGTDSGRAETCNSHNTYVAAWWASEGSDGRGRWVCYMDAVFDPECPIAPTHWMPLPTPPKEQA